MEYHLFISHSWKYPNAYDGLVSLLDKDYWFSYKDYSVPRDEPLTIYNKMYYESELEIRLGNQMRTCHVVLILAGFMLHIVIQLIWKLKLLKNLVNQ